MSQAVGGNLRRKYRILVAPLDWGLGHATRCVPIIRELLANECDVWLAGEGMQEALLKTEFPNCPFLPLRGYRIRYPRTGRLFFPKMVLQSPRIFATISYERRWLKKMISRYAFDCVISDNRFGLHHPSIVSIFITHQLMIRSPLGKWNEGMLRRLNYNYITRFTECWIPDVEKNFSLAGELSHPDRLPNIPSKYIGIVSRVERTGLPTNAGHILFMLSGPEPQRSIWEDEVVDAVSHYPGTATVLRGLPSAFPIIPSTGMIKFYNHLPAKELSAEMEKADLIISRSGYSTVMDIVKMGKKSVLVPTPGQTEQEYLAAHLLREKIAISITQDKSTLNTMLNEARKFNYQIPGSSHTNDYKVIVRDLLNRLRQ